MARLTHEMFPELTEETITDLFAHNIFTIVDFASESNDKLVKHTKLTYKDICDLKKCIFGRFTGNVATITESSYQEKHIASGIKELDLLLHKGFMPGHLYELCGLPSSGKTQLCLTIAVNHVLSKTKPVYYIDTKEDFCSTRVLEMLEAKCCTDEQIGTMMSLIKVSRIKNKEELLTLLHHLASTLKSEEPTFIIIDSLPSIFFKSSKNHQATTGLNQLTQVCKYLASECQQIVIVTNILSQWSEIDGFVLNQQTNPISVKPVLGKYWLHVPNTRLLIEHQDNETRTISVWKSTGLELELNCKVQIDNSGVK